ncbi:g10002 [Coccomyxa elongata]|nr:PHD finger protein ALFIN-LIKE 1 [Coccomyxa sp. Obi]
MAALRTVEDVFADYSGRRQGILTALTAEVDRFYAECDPDRENLCLYGNPDSTWEVDLPAEEVPPEMPEPALGINFARDGMQKKDWLSLVAVHSDTWLLAVAFYNGARLNREGRERLFELINEQPTCYEVVSGRVSRDVARPKKRGAPGQPARPAGLGAPAKNPRPVHPSAASRRHRDDEDDEEDEDEEEDLPGRLNDAEYADGEGDPCPNCGRVYRTGEFWIACDFCDTWYDGKCVQMTPQKAQRMGKWRCPACDRRQMG